ncbi:VanZ family protein [Mangrovibacterium sp.]|uniref:VanZ family protein n=1 Tax=Mangrovibacterium sp. TaxID=1961364 RepID=UPI00356651FE
MIKNNFITGTRIIKFSQAFTLIWGIIILVLCLIPASDLPKVNPIPNLDKIVHFILYFVFTVSAFTTKQLLGKKISTVFILSGFFLFSFSIEVLQAVLPFNRSFSLYDLLSNSSGLFAGWLAYKVIIAQRLSQSKS